MSLENIRVLHDNVMIRPMPLHLKKTADGIIIPGDMDKMAPKRATVVAAGPGTWTKNGTFVPGRFNAGDQVLYMERDMKDVKVDGEEFLMLKQEDVIAKIGFDEPGPNDTLVELSDDAYYAETVRRKLIEHLKKKGLVRLQDMINPMETFISSDGDHQAIAHARTFKVNLESIDDYVPPEEHKAFSMFKVNYVKIGSEVFVSARLAFLSRTDLTLG